MRFRGKFIIHVTYLCIVLIEAFTNLHGVNFRFMEEKNRSPENNEESDCDILQIQTFGLDCNYFLWDDNGTLLFSGNGTLPYKACYSPSNCYSMHIRSNLRSRWEYCSYQITTNSGTVYEELSRFDKPLVRIGDCDTNSCEDSELYFMTYGYEGMNFSYNDVLQQHIEFGAAKSLCFNSSQCIIFEKTGFSYFYFIEKGEISRSGPLRDLTRFGSCQEKLCEDMLIIRNKNEKKYPNFTLEANYNQQKVYSTNDGKYFLACVDYETCNTFKGEADSKLSLYREGYLFEEYFGNSSNEIKFGSCLCDFRLFNTPKGKEILLTLAPVSGINLLTNTTTPQFQAACWIIEYDRRQVLATSNSLIQRYVLATIFFATNGWHWDSHYKFLSSDNECNWNYGPIDKGVHCNEENLVVKLDLAASKMRGSIVTEVYFLRKLDYISISDNFLTGTIPYGIHRLNLKFFDVNNNKLGGQIPLGLFLMKGIEILELERNFFSGTIPPVAVDVSQLISFDAVGNLLSGTIPQWVGKATNLIMFDVSSNHMTGTISSDILNLQNLRMLYLGSNHLSGQLPSTLFQTLWRLEYVYLHDNLFTGQIPSPISPNSSMILLWLDKNHLTGTIPNQLFELSKLRDIVLSKNNLNHTQDFDFSDTSLAGFAIEHNNIHGSILSCTNKNAATVAIRADCRMPAKVSCDCCECSSVLENSQELLPCTSNLTLTFEDGDEYLQFVLRSEAGEVLLRKSQYTKAEPQYSTCISLTGCYSFEIIDSLSPYDIVVDGNVVTRLSKSVTMKFGYNKNGTQLQDSCDEFEICETVLLPGSAERVLFDKITKFTQYHVFQGKDSYQNDAFCWALKDMKTQNETKNTYPTERYLLASFYYVTNGSSWSNKTNWLTSKSECEWFGIVCDNMNKVNSIDLKHNNLTGFIPAELGSLVNIETLELSFNYLRGVLPKELAQLQILQKFRASHSSLSGTLSPEFGFLRNLKELDLSLNLLSNTFPKELANLVNLEHLNLANNEFARDLPTELNQLSNLITFNISKNLFQGKVNFLDRSMNLQKLDLSNNYFTGTLPIFGRLHRNLEVLRANGNDLSGTISPIIGEMVSMKELLLYHNNIRGTIPTAIGNLGEVERLSVSHNNIKGAIPKEIGKLNKLQLLHLHSNELHGSADHFDSWVQIHSFITDCGKTAAIENLVDCGMCTECCIEGDECINESRTWPNDFIKNFNERYSIESGVSIFILLLVGWVLMAGLSVVLVFMKDTLPTVLYQYKDYFHADSVYRFFLGSSKLGWLVAFCTVSFQIGITYTFFQAGDRTSITNEWVFSVTCPDDSLDCLDQNQADWQGWLIFTIILIIFVAPDFIEAFYLFYGSCTSEKFQMGGVFFSILLLSASTLSIVASSIYLYATSTSNASLLKDSVAILFLNELDEQMYKIVVQLDPSFIAKIEGEIVQFQKGVARECRRKGHSSSEHMMSDDANVLIDMSRSEGNLYPYNATRTAAPGPTPPPSHAFNNQGEHVALIDISEAESNEENVLSGHGIQSETSLNTELNPNNDAAITEVRIMPNMLGQNHRVDFESITMNVEEMRKVYEDVKDIDFEALREEKLNLLHSVYELKKEILLYQTEMDKMKEEFQDELRKMREEMNDNFISKDYVKENYLTKVEIYEILTAFKTSVLNEQKVIKKERACNELKVINLARRSATNKANHDIS